MRVENENESSHNKIESRDWEWDESFPWESQFRDRDESLAEVCDIEYSFMEIDAKVYLIRGFWACWIDFWSF